MVEVIFSSLLGRFEPTILLAMLAGIAIEFVVGSSGK
jgi:hypothetical protein